jgi:hypothetical protein
VIGALFAGAVKSPVVELTVHVIAPAGWLYVSTSDAETPVMIGAHAAPVPPPPEIVIVGGDVNPEPGFVTGTPHTYFETLQVITAGVPL